jgi:hypothetical protein
MHASDMKAALIPKDLADTGSLSEEQTDEIPSVLGTIPRP